MVSSTTMYDGTEGWAWVEKLERTCTDATTTTTTTTTTINNNTASSGSSSGSHSIHNNKYNSIYYPDVILPTFIHYCQNFDVNMYNFHKLDVPKNIFQCQNNTILNDPVPESIIYYGDLNKIVTNVTKEVRYIYIYIYALVYDWLYLLYVYA